MAKGKGIADETCGSGETELAKRVIPAGKTRGMLVLAYRRDDNAPQVVVREYKKVTGGWRCMAYQPYPASVWRGIASAILDLTRG